MTAVTEDWRLYDEPPFVEEPIDDYRVYDLEGLKALPFGTQFPAATYSFTKGTWAVPEHDPKRYWELHEDGLRIHYGDGRVSRAYGHLEAFFLGIRPGQKISRRILNPEILGTFTAV